MTKSKIPPGRAKFLHAFLTGGGATGAAFEYEYHSRMVVVTIGFRDGRPRVQLRGRIEAFAAWIRSSRGFGDLAVFPIPVTPDMDRDYRLALSRAIELAEAAEAEVSP